MSDEAMRTITGRRLLVALLAFVPAVLAGQGRGLAPTEIYKPLGDSWPTYCDDYSCRRYSTLKQIDQSNVKSLTLA